MELNITAQNENLLLNRSEVKFTVRYDGTTPSRKQVKELLCSKLSADPKKVVIDSIIQGFGKGEVRGYAKVYKDEASASVEQNYKVNRDAGTKKTAQKAAAAPKPKAEAAKPKA